jgi:hypothetical protein
LTLGQGILLTPHFKIQNRAVTRRYSSHFRPPGFASRALSLFLLSLVLYGTTIEIAHSHGRILSTNPSEQSPSISQSNAPTHVAGGQLGCSECLLCQFHKNFSTTTITVRDASASPTTRLGLQCPSSVAFESHTNSPQKGRAPPLAN